MIDLQAKTRTDQILLDCPSCQKQVEGHSCTLRATTTTTTTSSSSSSSRRSKRAKKNNEDKVAAVETVTTMHASHKETRRRKCNEEKFDSLWYKLKSKRTGDFVGRVDFGATSENGKLYLQDLTIHDQVMQELESQNEATSYVSEEWQAFDIVFRVCGNNLDCRWEMRVDVETGAMEGSFTALYPDFEDAKGADVQSENFVLVKPTKAEDDKGWVPACWHGCKHARLTYDSDSVDSTKPWDYFD